MGLEHASAHDRVEMPGAVCSPTRGLLVAVAVEVFDEGSWHRGASLHLRWRYLPALVGDITPHATTKDQYLLTDVVDGADVDGGVAEPAVLVEYRTVAPPAPLRWRQPPGEVRSGLGGLQDEPGALMAKLSYDAAAPWLLAKVERPVMILDDSIATVAEEEFEWEEQGDGSYAIGSHQSRGLELSASQPPIGPRGVMSWTENGQALTMLFDRGRPVECKQGDCGAHDRPRDLMTSVENNR